MARSETEAGRVVAAGKTVLDWLREMKPSGGGQQCKGTSLPRFWELPRRLSTYGCLEGGHVVARGAFKGLRLQYRIVYDAELWRQIEAARAEREKVVNRAGVLQAVADALYELAEKYEVGLVKRCRYGMSRVPLRCEHFVVVNGIEVRAGVCYGARSGGECASRILQEAELERERVERERRKRLDYYL
jgi:hypothetical protein